MFSYPVWYFNVYLQLLLVMVNIIISLISFLFVMVTVLPLVRNDYWTFRSMEYPRLQKLFLGIIIVAFQLIFLKGTDIFLWNFLPALVAIIYLVIKIFPYTFFYKREMKVMSSPDEKAQVKILTANVLETNTQFQKLLNLVADKDPDIVFLVETDQKWNMAMMALDKKYPYSLKIPLDNTYGMLFFSRLKLRNEEVVFRVEKDVPSVETEVQLPSGVWVKVFGLHPKPPVPGESMYSTAKDKELMKVAALVEKEVNPCIVMGDLNDVAWSHVTMLFRKVSGLLDPRRGRGFFSTFSALHWWFRFPLDYIFCSYHFGLVKMEKLPSIGSDHFAMFIHLQHQPGLHQKTDEPKADGSEKKEAEEKAKEPVK
jgi:endonuclease/exonuclease/phosphatase (EEP) superfamily protein YafD